MAKRKKKKKTTPLAPEPTVDPFIPDELVEGDCPNFLNRRIFTVKNVNHQYTFREHFLYFPWENNKSKFYSEQIPPAAYHLEKRSDLKNFDFFSFIKSKSSIGLYRFARQQALCDDLLEYISDSVEIKARELFRQSLEESRKSKLLINLPQDQPIQPLFTKNYSECHFMKLAYKNRPNPIGDPRFDEFLRWFNTLDDPLVSEIEDFNSDFKLELSPFKSNNFDILDQLDSMMIFESVEDSTCVRRLIQSLISKHYRKYGTKFKFSLNASPGYGKTRIKNMFHQFLITDLDDISMLDPIEGPIFHKLVNARKWNDQRLEYHRVIKSKFKEGILLGQNSHQSPEELPFLNVITPGHLGRKKLWSDRGLYDLVIKNSNKLFVSNSLVKNQLIEIIYDEVYNSLNYA